MRWAHREMMDGEQAATLSPDTMDLDNELSSLYESNERLMDEKTLHQSMHFQLNCL